MKNSLLHIFQFIVLLVLPINVIYAQDKASKSKGYISLAGGASMPVGNYGSFGAGYSNSFQKGYGNIGYFASAEVMFKIKNKLSLFVSGGYNSNDKNNNYFGSDFRNNNPTYNYYNYANVLSSQPNQLKSVFIGTSYTVPIAIVLVDFKLGLGLINSTNGYLQDEVINYYNTYTLGTSVAYTYTSVMQNKTQAAFTGGINIRYNYSDRIGFRIFADYFQTFSNHSDVNISTSSYSKSYPTITQKVKYTINVVNAGAGIVFNL